MMKFLVLLAVVILWIAVFKTHFISKAKDFVKTQASKTEEKSDEKSEPTGSLEPYSPVARSKIHITAIPGNAELAINGLPHGNTPATIDLPKNMKVSLTFKAKGYKPLTKEFVVSSPQDVQGVLEKISADKKPQNAPAPSAPTTPSKKKTKRRAVT